MYIAPKKRIVDRCLKLEGSSAGERGVEGGEWSWSSWVWENLKQEKKMFLYFFRKKWPQGPLKSLWARSILLARGSRLEF